MIIGYTTENPAKEYSIAIRKAKNKEELLKVLNEYKEIADDAIEVAKKFSNQDFIDFIRDIKKAKTSKNTEWCKYFVDRFGLIALPRKLFLSSILEQQCFAPWGCCFIRCQENGWK